MSDADLENKRREQRDRDLFTAKDFHLIGTTLKVSLPNKQGEVVEAEFDLKTLIDCVDGQSLSS